MSTVHVVNGDLLESDATVIVHQANCQAVMGAGIAREIARLYPSAYNADRNFNIPKGEQRLGKLSHSFVDGPHGRVLVINLYAQVTFGRARDPQEQQQRYHAFKRGLRNTVNTVQKMSGQHKIGLPHGIGCGLAGSDWKVISQIIQDVATEFEHDIYLYKL